MKTKGGERERIIQESLETSLHTADTLRNRAGQTQTRPAPEQNNGRRRRRRDGGGGDEKKKKEKTFVTKGAKYLRLDKNYFPLTLNNN